MSKDDVSSIHALLYVILAQLSKSDWIFLGLMIAAALHLFAMILRSWEK